MIRGYYAAASSLAALLRRQEVLSQNLANLNTPGFKQELTVAQDPGEASLISESASRRDGAIVTPPIGLLPTGVDGSLTTVDFGQGPLANTGQPWDLAILGNGFFRVQTPDGERLTRDGNFHRDSAGRIVTSDGYYLLGANGPVQVGEGAPSVMEDGTIYVGGLNGGEGAQPAARIELATVANPAALLREEDNLYDPANAGVGRAAAGTASIRQLMLESANVDVSGNMVSMMAVLRSYEAVQRTMKLQDETMQRTLEIGRLG
jgi:flagellar basal-body rod protein FlgG